MKGFRPLVKKLIIVACFLLLSLASASGLVFANLDSGGGGGVGVSSPTINGTDLSQLGIIFVRVVTFLIGIAGAITIILIVIGGIRYILSAGDPKAMQSARNSLTFAIIGLIIILLAVSIVLFIGNVLGVPNLNFVKIGP